MTELQEHCPCCEDTDVLQIKWPKNNDIDDVETEIMWVLNTGPTQRVISFCPFCGVSLNG